MGITAKGGCTERSHSLSNILKGFMCSLASLSLDDGLSLSLSSLSLLESLSLSELMSLSSEPILAVENHMTSHDFTHTHTHH